MNNLERIYYKSLLIRQTEYKIEELFSLGILRGTTHGCIGQEAVPVALSELLDIENDYVCGGHRSHGLAVSLTLKPEFLIGEIMGKSCGFVKGLGGSQHIAYKNFFTNGITGGMVPVTAGLALSIKLEKRNAIAAVCFGDGAMNEGYVLETFNLAGMMQLPMLFVLENNGFAMTTSVDYASTYNNFKSRVEGFGLKYMQVEASDYANVFDTLENGVSSVRNLSKPVFIEVFTHRFCGHSKSDSRDYMPPERDQYWKEHDFLKKIEIALSAADVKIISDKISDQIEKAYNLCCEL